MQLLKTPFSSIIIAACFVACSPSTKLTKVETSMISFNESENKTENNDIAKLIDPYRKAMENEMNEVLIESEAPLIKEQPESALGDLVADITWMKANEAYQKKYNSNVDLALLNNGGLRTNLPKGKITKGKVYELMPFENEIFVLTLSGAKTKELFDYVAKAHGMPMSKIKLGIKDTLATTILINGQALDIHRNYTVATSDYLASGGDKMKFFKDPVKVDTTHCKIRTALIEYMKQESAKGNKMNYKKDGRIYYE